MYKGMMWLADMAKSFRQAAGIIDEIVEKQRSAMRNVYRIL